MKILWFPQFCRRAECASLNYVRFASKALEVAPTDYGFVMPKLHEKTYGKTNAYYVAFGDWTLYFSFSTLVLAANEKTGRVIRFWKGWSRTTAEHIRAISKVVGGWSAYSVSYKATWEKLPVNVAPCATAVSIIGNKL